MQQIRQDNHYVTQSYLRRWSIDGNTIYGYRLLVSHENVPLWKQHSIRSIAYQKHLYTKTTKNGESDEFEKWIADEFENPAEGSINKVIEGKRLFPDDWDRLIRFAAVQYVRTPARLSENMNRWQNQIPEIQNRTLKRTQKTLEENKNYLRNAKSIVDKNSMPFEIRIVSDSESDQSRIEINTLMGRSLWLWEMKNVLTKTFKILLRHRWYILAAHPGFEWVTSDDPVICLNYYGNNKYDFKGGWGRKGSEIILPLSSEHLLYTQVGHKPISKHSKTLNLESSIRFQKLFIERAFRWIFAKKPMDEIIAFRPRKVDANMFASEKIEWRNWHLNQSSEEQKYNLE
jgi:hypothetical protein